MSIIHYNLPLDEKQPINWLGSLLRYIPGELIVVELTADSKELGDSMIKGSAMLAVKATTKLFDDLNRIIIRNRMVIGDHFMRNFKGNTYWVEITKPEVLHGLSVFVLHGESHKFKIMEAIMDLNSKLDGIEEKEICAVLSKLQF